MVHRPVRWVCVALLLISAAPSFSQTRPDLNGEWELVMESEPGNAAYSSPLGLRASVTHTVQVLILTPTVIKAAPSNLHGKERTLTLDGSEIREAGVDATGEPFVWLSRVESVSGALVITTSHPRGTEQEWRELTILSILGGGELEILRVGPNLWPPGTTNSKRFVYRRRP
jgi:hypothetical protein